MGTIERVAARHRAAAGKRAAFIPDKFFKGYETELKKLFTESLGNNPLEDAPFLILDRMVPLHSRFITELIEKAPSAKVALEDRLALKKAQIDRLVESMRSSRRAYDLPYPMTSARDHILLHVYSGINDQLAKAIPTLGKALKTNIYIDPGKVEALVGRAAKKASPEVAAALESDDYSHRNLQLKYEFLAANVDKSIPRLVQKSKIVIDWLAWFSFTRDLLDSNYSTPRLTEFDLNGMKVVVDDATVGAGQHDLYVKYLDKAYHLLKAKKLGRAWYGTVYIECESCGGVNPNTGGGVGGHFNIGKDHVKIFSRPSGFIVELMAHELGHRYWFKSLSSAQRAKFESLVRAHKTKRPEGIIPKIIDPKELEPDKQRIQEAEKSVEGVLQRFLAAPVDATYLRVVHEFESQLSKAAWDFKEISTIILNVVVPEGNAELRTLYLDARKSVEEVDELLTSRRLGAVRDQGSFAAARAAFVEDVRQAVSLATTNAFIYQDYSLQIRNEAEKARASEAGKAWQKEWEDDEREILPVTSYGRSNIDEAFAEVFAWYVLDGVKMTAEQEASFRAVLLDQDRTAARVADRWSKVYGEGSPCYPLGGSSPPS